MAFYIFPKAVPKDICKQYLDYCLKNAQFQDADIVKGGHTALASDESSHESNHDVRKTDISFIDDENDLMNELCWGFIRETNTRCFKYKLDHFQPIQFARYQDGGHYDWHQDDTLIDVNGGKEVRKLSLTFSLTDDSEYDGGLLEFFNGSKEMIKDGKNLAKDIKSVGTAIVFDSSDWHRVTPVTRGIRYSLVCWTIGPRFE